LPVWASDMTAIAAAPYKVIARVALWVVGLGFNTVVAAGTVKIKGLMV